MKNRIIRRAIALFLALTLCVSCLVSCDFKNSLRETYHEPKQLVGVDNLTEEEIKTANMINEKVKKFYALYAESQDGFDKERFVAQMKEVFYIGADAVAMGVTKDWLGYFLKLASMVPFSAQQYEELSCVSIVVTGDTAEVIIELISQDGTVKYNKTELVCRDEEWFLTSFPVSVNYTPAS